MKRKTIVLPSAAVNGPVFHEPAPDRLVQLPSLQDALVHSHKFVSNPQLEITADWDMPTTENHLLV